jgi:hypothetical protein
MQGDGVRHNRAGEIAGANDSWLPGGARSFLFRRKAATILTANAGVFIDAPAVGGLEQTCA